ncbi:hypothetical protein J1N35_045469 [Gossypium stocksii]|uniref:RNase H type-1 domain-containing protein n=1 Tax=Gossypium stocksii TaxID=47602 RepID=A0A9D3UBE6_9ROSI|nr:hypothetical protein J1N35_045469 [Gossypium stocksii]
MATKDDVEKAYEWVQWDFLQDTLYNAGLPEVMVEDKYFSQGMFLIRWLNFNGKIEDAFGEVIRGPNGGWLVGFEMVTRLTDIFQIKARAMLEGLKIAWACGFHQVEVESDNALLVDIPRNRLVGTNSIAEVRMIHT